MTATSKIARVSFAALAAFFAIEPVHAQWTGGPVLIGGDDIDNHFGDGSSYMREGFNFLGAQVTNGKTMVVCIGCNTGDATENFATAFDASDLPGMMWTREILILETDIQAFFDNTGTVKIQDTGILYLPSSGNEVTGGIMAHQLDVVNDIGVLPSRNREILRAFVKDPPPIDGGGLFTHTLHPLTNAYLWLETLVPGVETQIVVGAEEEVHVLNLDCHATATFFAGLECEEIESVRLAKPWHTRFVIAPEATDYGGLVPVARGSHERCSVVILAAPALDGMCTDCNNNGIRDDCDDQTDCQPNGIADTCDIALGRSRDCTCNGIPDECEPDCNMNDIADSCDIAAGTSPDCVSYTTDCCFAHAGTRCDDAEIADCVCYDPSGPQRPSCCESA